MDKQKKKSDRPNESKGNEESKRDSKSRIYSEPTSDSTKRPSTIKKSKTTGNFILDIKKQNEANLKSNKKLEKEIVQSLCCKLNNPSPKFRASSQPINTIRAKLIEQSKQEAMSMKNEETTSSLTTTSLFKPKKSLPTPENRPNYGFKPNKPEQKRATGNNLSPRTSSGLVRSKASSDLSSLIHDDTPPQTPLPQIEMQQQMTTSKEMRKTPAPRSAFAQELKQPKANVTEKMWNPLDYQGASILTNDNEQKEDSQMNKRLNPQYSPELLNAHQLKVDLISDESSSEIDFLKRESESEEDIRDQEPPSRMYFQRNQSKSADRRKTEKIILKPNDDQELSKRNLMSKYRVSEDEKEENEEVKANMDKNKRPKSTPLPSQYQPLQLDNEQPISVAELKNKFEKRSAQIINAKIVRRFSGKDSKGESELKKSSVIDRGNSEKNESDNKKLIDDDDTMHYQPPRVASPPKLLNLPKSKPNQATTPSDIKNNPPKPVPTLSSLQTIEHTQPQVTVESQQQQQQDATETRLLRPIHLRPPNEADWRYRNGPRLTPYQADITFANVLVRFIRFEDFGELRVSLNPTWVWENDLDPHIRNIKETRPNYEQIADSPDCLYFYKWYETFFRESPIGQVVVDRLIRYVRQGFDIRPLFEFVESMPKSIPEEKNCIPDFIGLIVERAWDIMEHFYEQDLLEREMFENELKTRKDMNEESLTTNRSILLETEKDVNNIVLPGNVSTIIDESLLSHDPEYLKISLPDENAQTMRMRSNVKILRQLGVSGNEMKDDDDDDDDDDENEFESLTNDPIVTENEYVSSEDAFFSVKNSPDRVDDDFQIRKKSSSDEGNRVVEEVEMGGDNDLKYQEESENIVDKVDSTKENTLVESEKESEKSDESGDKESSSSSVSIGDGVYSSDEKYTESDDNEPTDLNKHAESVPFPNMQHSLSQDVSSDSLDNLQVSDDENTIDNLANQNETMIAALVNYQNSVANYGSDFKPSPSSSSSSSASKSSSSSSSKPKPYNNSLFNSGPQNSSLLKNNNSPYIQKTKLPIHPNVSPIKESKNPMVCKSPQKKTNDNTPKTHSKKSPNKDLDDVFLSDDQNLMNVSSSSRISLASNSELSRDNVTPTILKEKSPQKLEFEKNIKSELSPLMTKPTKHQQKSSLVFYRVPYSPVQVVSPLRERLEQSFSGETIRDYLKELLDDLESSLFTDDCIQDVDFKRYLQIIAWQINEKFKADGSEGLFKYTRFIISGFLSDVKKEDDDDDDDEYMMPVVNLASQCFWDQSNDECIEKVMRRNGLNGIVSIYLIS